MARTAVTVTDLTAETATAVVDTTIGVAIDATNHHSITPPAGCDPRDLLLVVVNTTASTKAATLLAGDNPPAVRQGAGDLSISLTDGSTTPTKRVVPLSPSRFQQDDGTYNIDIAASMTGRIACFRMPRNA